MDKLFLSFTENNTWYNFVAKILQRIGHYFGIFHNLGLVELKILWHRLKYDDMSKKARLHEIGLFHQKNRPLSDRTRIKCSPFLVAVDLIRQDAFEADFTHHVYSWKARLVINLLYVYIYLLQSNCDAGYGVVVWSSLQTWKHRKVDFVIKVVQGFFPRLFWHATNTFPKGVNSSWNHSSHKQVDF